jgi:magnesium chelatase family protein
VARSGKISLAYNGVLFIDEFPKLPHTVLETLRQPIEIGEVVVARANAYGRYPCLFMLVADGSDACGRAPICGEDYMGRISGPLMDRFDLPI